MSELVPLSYSRDAYNAIHGTELQTHTNSLTAEQATRINETFDIELHVGRHGLITHDTDNLRSRLDLPGEQDYEAAAAVVEDMQPGDVLFIENNGFKSQPESLSTPSIESQLAKEAIKDKDVNWRAIAQLALYAENITKDFAREWIEENRRDHKISAWDYAESLAALKGIDVVYADHDAFEMESIRAISGGKTSRELFTSSIAEDRALAGRIYDRREWKHPNVVKDWALAHLPKENVPTDRKTKLRAIFGAGHKDGLKQTYDNLGLDVKVVEMKMSTARQRHLEQIAYASESRSTVSSAPALRAQGLSSPMLPERISPNGLEAYRKAKSTKASLGGVGLKGLRNAAGGNRTYKTSDRFKKNK